MGNKVYSYCGNVSEVTPMIWRDAFIAKICGVTIPDDMEIRTLSDEAAENIQCEKYTEALAHLLILFGAGYIDEETVETLAVDSEKYAKHIFEVEDFVISHADNPDEEIIGENVVKNILLCMASSERFEEIRGTSFEKVRTLCESTYTTIRNGFVFPKDRNFLTVLVNFGEPMGYFDNDGKIRVLSGEEIVNGFSDEDKTIEQLLNESEGMPDMPFLLNLNDTYHIMEIYGKPYSMEFIGYAKSENIPFDDEYAENFRKYVIKNKLRFSISAIQRKRVVCGDEVNYFDYCTAVTVDGKIELGENYDITETVDLISMVNENDELSEQELIQKAVGQFLRKNALAERTVLEVTHCGKKLLYVYSSTDGLIPLNSESFRKIPFDYNNIWTTVMEWSRRKKIRKQGDTITIPEEEWDKIPVRERKYAQRLIEEQYSLMKRNNKMLRKLSELQAYAQSEADKKRQISARQNELKAAALKKESERKNSVEE